MRRRARAARALALALSLGLAAPAAGASSFGERLAGRGPATFFVGAMFSVGAPPAMLVGAVTGGRTRLQACRFGHGLKMLAAGAVLLPAGLLAAPFYASVVPTGWLDGVVESMEEDYCSRPATSLFP